MPTTNDSSPLASLLSVSARRAAVRRAGQQRRAHRLAGHERLQRREMLLGERLGRRHEDGLHVVLDGAQDGVQRDDRLARADLPHQQALHRARLGELVVDRRHRAQLVAGRARRAAAPRASARDSSGGRSRTGAELGRAALRAAAQQRELREQQLVERQAPAAALVVAGVGGDERRRPVGQRAAHAQRAPAAARSRARAAARCVRTSARICVEDRPSVAG